MKRNILILAFLLVSGLANKGFAAASAIIMKSPSGNLSAEILHKNGLLFYCVKANTEFLINSSALGMVIDGIAYGTKVSSITKTPSNSQLKGYAFYKVQVSERGRKYFIEFQLSNHGFAFRYIFNGNNTQKISKELTTFSLPKAEVWFFERNNSWKLKTYAGLWQKTVTDSLSIISSQGPIQGKPLVLSLSTKKYLLFTEAALYNYSGLRFRALGDRKIQADYTEKDGFNVDGNVITPWRLMLYSENLNDLINQTMIADLNPSSDVKLFSDKSYIKPGRAVWSWITRNENYMQPAEEMKFIDAAAELNFEYSLIDEGWETKWPEKWKQLKEICDYAKQKKVGIWVWKNSKTLRDPLHRDAILDSIKAAGVAGIKTDFMDSETKELIDFEIGFLAACAKRKLMVNFHGCHVPTGESKTYPNEMTREGIRGMELNIMNEPIPAWHNAALPFTRLVLGHGDYTPGLFYNKSNTTNAHQLALLYLFNSPMQCLAENPIKLLADVKFKPIIPLLKTLPVTWDETIALEGNSIGKLVIFAKRKGESWYIIAINGTNEKQPVSITPYFLKKMKKYKAVTITDAEHGDGFLKSENNITHTSKQLLTIAPNGGLVIEIKL